MCKSWCELIVAIVVIVFGWPGLIDFYNGWILVAAGVVLAIHSFTCKKCFPHSSMMAMKEMKSMPKRRKRR